MPENRRYHRQIILPGFGMEAQQKLSVTRILVIGAGGLGCPALLSLAAAGAGTLGIVDFDKVELSNLHRQTLYDEGDIGKPKAEVAAEKLRRNNSEIELNIHEFQLDAQNATNILSGYDIVMDGSDNFPTRYLVNDACVILGKPLIYGAVQQYEGQVGVFNFNEENSGKKTNYRDLFPVPPSPGTSPSCSEAGVMGTLPAIIGNLQALEAIKIITGIGKVLSNRILTYNSLNSNMYEVTVTPGNTEMSGRPISREELSVYDYGAFCRGGLKELTASEFEFMRMQQETEIIDVREPGEFPRPGFDCVNIPLSSLESGDVHEMKNKVILVCSSGIRSLKAAGALREKYPEKEFFSLKGGLLGIRQD